jgi:hypothetical protein
MQFSTDYAVRLGREALKASQDFVSDTRRAKRLEACECRACFYLRPSRVGGSAMTFWNCGLCAEEGLHGSTAVPKVCRPCGLAHSICTHCGGDMEMRTKRRVWPTPVPDSPFP